MTQLVDGEQEASELIVTGVIAPAVPVDEPQEAPAQEQEPVKLAPDGLPPEEVEIVSKHANFNFYESKYNISSEQLNTLPKWARECIVDANFIIGHAPGTLAVHLSELQNLRDGLKHYAAKADRAMAIMVTAQIELATYMSWADKEIDRLAGQLEDVKSDARALKVPESLVERQPAPRDLPQEIVDSGPVEEPVGLPGQETAIGPQALEGEIEPDRDVEQGAWQACQTARMLAARYWYSPLKDWVGLDEEARAGVASKLIDEDSRKWLLDSRAGALGNKSDQERRQYDALKERQKAARLAEKNKQGVNRNG